MASPVDLMGLVRERERAHDHDFERDVEAAFHVEYGADLAKPLPPKPWLCRDLRIAPGAPMIFGGAGYSGKTMAAQALALSVATGRPAWGHFPVRQGEVLHLDWEQRELTKRRYQRMARSMKVDLAELGPNLGASMIPRTTLDANGAERALAHMCKGKALCMIDSFRQAFERTDENSSADVAIAMKMLGRVSDATGCVMLVIAHSRKLTDDGSNIRGSLRGSGALFDQSDTVYMLSALKGKPAYVENVKERHTGKEIPKFGLRTSDDVGPNLGDDPYVEGDLDPEWGLRVEYVSGPEMQVEYDVDEGDDNALALNVERVETLGMRILDILGRSDGLGMAMIRAATGCSAAQASAAIEMLERTGAIIREGRGPTTTFTAVPKEREPGID